MAAFDFDGTLVPRDSFIGFLRLVAGPGAVSSGLVRSWRAALRAGRDPAWRDATKAILVQRALAGVPASVVADAANRYAGLLLPRIPAPMRRLIAGHHRAGHLSVIVSASLELYLEPIRVDLGMHSVLATRLEIGPDGCLSGAMVGANCRGPEKARRLAEWMQAIGLAAGSVPLWAYGDSAGDREMLAAATVPTRVRRARLPTGHPASPRGAGGPPD